MRSLRITFGPQPRLAVAFVTTRFTESLRVPVTPENRRLLREARAAELRLWEQTGGRADQTRAAALTLSPLRL